MVPGVIYNRASTWDMQQKTMQKTRQKLFTACRVTPPSASQGPGKSHHMEPQTQPSFSPKKKILLSFKSQKKTNTICLLLGFLISLKTKQAFRGSRARGRVGKVTD